MTTEHNPSGKTTTRSVPVTCSACGKDMFYTTIRHNINQRTWILHCGHCGVVEISQRQKWVHLWMNDDTVYIGSYWGPDD